jgi:transposase-like protein
MAMRNNNRKPKMTPYIMKQFQAQFPDDATCLEWLRNYLYPDGIFCEKCNAVTKHHRVLSRPSYSCDHCGHHVHPTADTIFHKSPTPLTTWFYAIYLMASTRCGISAKQIQRETGVTYKTAWRMFKQIRSMLADDSSPLGGKGKGIEIDETYYGGKRKRGTGRPMRGDKTKIPVMGIVERGGSVKALAIPDVSGATMLPLVKKFVLPQSTVYTDELRSYHGISHMTAGYHHRRINHSANVYVLGDIHTNTVEGLWSLIKRGIGGVYHSVSHKYLQTYLNEYTFRYNRRFDVQPMFTSFLQQIEKQEVTEKQKATVSEPESIPEPF